MLLLHAGVDPSALGNEALCVAAHYKHARIVAMLLRDSRVDSAAK
jgi:hypothetical protein